MRDWKETLEWYKTHNTAREIGFNPDNMCLKVCRTAREIGPMFLTAKDCQDAVPEAYRIRRVRDLRRGDVLFFDDPKDSNKAGHIVTMVGRVKGFNWDSLDDVLVETNSVVSGKLVVVRASYFLKHWGDPFVFGSRWLNGEVLDRPDNRTRVERFRRSGPSYDMQLLEDAITKGHRSDLRPHVRRIEALVDSLPDDKRRTAIQKFKADFAKGNLRMGLLNEIAGDGSDREVLEVRNRLRRELKRLPER